MLYFYEEQLQRMESLCHEPVHFNVSRKKPYFLYQCISKATDDTKESILVFFLMRSASASCATAHP
jgi:hypothetical protein